MVRIGTGTSLVSRFASAGPTPTGHAADIVAPPLVTQDGRTEAKPTFKGAIFPLDLLPYRWSSNVCLAEALEQGEHAAMRVTFKCDPALIDLLPRPRLAREAVPDWLRAMPASAFSDVDGVDVRTVKQCPPFVDAMSYG